MHAQGAGGAPGVLAEVTAGVLLVVAMLFGGGSRGAGDLVVHLVALPAFVLGIIRWRHADASRLQRLFLYWLLAAFALIGLQLLPLPVSMFAAMPARAAILTELGTAGLDPAWLPMTLDRWGTVRALLALLSFAAMWLLASTLDRAAQWRLLQLAIIAAVPMALLGFAQAAAGHQPTLRFYDFHNTFGATATFANRNHFASLLAMLIPFAIVAGHRALQLRRHGRMLAWYGAAIVLLLAAALTFSRAGVVLAALAAGSTVVWLLYQEGFAIRRGGSSASRALLLVSLVAAVAIAVYAWSGIVERFVHDPIVDLRTQYVRHSLQAAAAYLPWGSGLGSFPLVYAPFEPVVMMVEVYALHAHNELLELAIETGIPGMALLLALLALIVAGMRNSRRNSEPRDAIMLGVALSTFVPLAHSLADYPLRTLAVASLFAVLLARLIAPTYEALPSPPSSGPHDALHR